MVLPSDICDVCIEGGNAANVDDLVTHSFIIFNASFQCGVYQKQTTLHVVGVKYYPVVRKNYDSLDITGQSSQSSFTLTDIDSHSKTNKNRDPITAHCIVEIGKCEYLYTV